LANEIYATYNEGNDLYALIWRKSDDKVFNNTTNAFVTYTDAGIADLVVPLANVELESDYYSVDFPSEITGTDPLAYRVQVMLQIGGSPEADDDFAIRDGEIIWDGTKEIDLGVIFNTNQTTLNRYNEITTIVIDETETI
jgi:hypothetical protein